MLMDASIPPPMTLIDNLYGPDLMLGGFVAHSIWLAGSVKKRSES